MSTASTPRITASVLRDAATRLLGAVVQFVEDGTIGAAVYQPRMQAWLTLDGQDLGEDDGTVIALVPPGHAMTLLEEHGTAGAAVRVVNEELRREWSA